MSVFDAKSNLSKLIEFAASGDKVVITNRGKPVAEVIPFVPKTQTGYGVLKGQFSELSWEQADEEFNASFNKDKLQ